MESKVSELSGPALDWAVAKCEDKVETGVYGVPITIFSELFLNYCDVVLSYPYKPSIDWEQGGPIIEREKICLTQNSNSGSGDEWGAEYSSYESEGYGATPLIAAMRCYVASKLGDVINIPEELA